MALAKVRQVVGRAVPVAGDDIDTDRIIPARFMKCVTFDGLGRYAFYDVRFDERGASKGHPIDAPKFSGASILVSGRNFGCGSSREHAPQALSKLGIQAIVAESFAEIFFGNATTLGMPCVSLAKGDLARLAARVEAEPAAPVRIDLEAGVVDAGALSLPLTMKEAARRSLLDGEWDPIARLLAAAPRARELAARLPYPAFGDG